MVTNLPPWARREGDGLGDFFEELFPGQARAAAARRSPRRARSPPAGPARHARARALAPYPRCLPDSENSRPPPPPRWSRCTSRGAGRSHRHIARRKTAVEQLEMASETLSSPSSQNLKSPSGTRCCATRRASRRVVSCLARALARAARALLRRLRGGRRRRRPRPRAPAARARACGRGSGGGASVDAIRYVQLLSDSQNLKSRSGTSHRCSGRRTPTSRGCRTRGKRSRSGSVESRRAGGGAAAAAAATTAARRGPRAARSPSRARIHAARERPRAHRRARDAARPRRAEPTPWFDSLHVRVSG